MVIAGLLSENSSINSITNSVKYLHKELILAQKEYVESFIDSTMYDRFRNNILFNEWDDFEGVIKIHFPSLKMECYDEYGVLLN